MGVGLSLSSMASAAASLTYPSTSLFAAKPACPVDPSDNPLVDKCTDVVNALVFGLLVELVVPTGGYAANQWKYWALWCDVCHYILCWTEWVSSSITYSSPWWDALRLHISFLGIAGCNSMQCAEPLPIGEDNWFASKKNFWSCPP